MAKEKNKLKEKKKTYKKTPFVIESETDKIKSDNVERPKSKVSNTDGIVRPAFELSSIVS